MIIFICMEQEVLTQTPKTLQEYGWKECEKDQFNTKLIPLTQLIFGQLLNNQQYDWETPKKQWLLAQQVQNGHDAPQSISRRIIYMECTGKWQGIYLERLYLVTIWK